MGIIIPISGLALTVNSSHLGSIYMSKPFPPPPFQNSRATAAPDPAASPFGPPKHAETKEPDPRMKDEDITLLFKTYLRHDQLDKPELLHFILSYCTHRNVSQAGKESGLNNPTYWRQRPEVHACIEAITARAVIKYGYDSHEVVERAKEIATLDPIEFQNPDGTFKTHLSEIRPEARRAIKKFEAKNIFGQDANGMPVVTGVLLKVELWDKLKGIELLASEKNIFKKTTVVQHDMTNNMKDVLLESGNRAEERLRLMAAREVGESEAVSGTTESSIGDEGREDDGVPVG